MEAFVVLGIEIVRALSVKDVFVALYFAAGKVSDTLWRRDYCSVLF